MIAINERSKEKIPEILKILNKRGYRIYPGGPSSAFIDFDITGRWKNFEVTELGASDNVITKVNLGIGFDLRTDRFCSILSINGRASSSLYPFKSIVGDYLWNKYYGSLYQLVKPLGIEGIHHDQSQLMTRTYPYKDKFIDKYIYSLDDGIRKVLPRIKAILEPPTQRGRF